MFEEGLNVDFVKLWRQLTDPENQTVTRLFRVNQNPLIPDLLSVYVGMRPCVCLYSGWSSLVNSGPFSL